MQSLIILPTLLVLALVLSAVAWDWRSPLFAGYRMEVLISFGLAAILIVVSGAAIWRARRKAEKRPFHANMAGGAALIAAISLLSVAMTEAKFQWMRHQVLNADPERLAALGRHFVVGYRDIAEAESLAAHHAVGGFFVTHRNVVGKTADDVRQEIDRLQALRDSAVHRLWIASDQEGGGVSRLSPPLPRQPALSRVVAEHKEPDERARAVRAYALAQGHGLASLGVNLDLAPVVDLNHHVFNPEDRYTRIFERAIGSDPAMVSSTGRTYCRALASAGVRCTLKHFPGIGRVYNDTHVQGALLSTSTDLLSKTDWRPFRFIMADTPAPFVMLSHVRLMEVDTERPASYSHRVVTGLLREKWGFDGGLITDDFSMRSVFDSEEGIGGAAVAALNAGVDLILISFDPDQYYPAIYAVLKADEAGKLSHAALRDSDRRLDSAIQQERAALRAAGAAQ